MTTPSSHSTSAVRIGLRAICRRVQRPWSSLTGAPYRETKGPIGAVVSGRRGLDAYYVDGDQFWSRGRQHRLRISILLEEQESARAAGATPDLRSTAAAIAAYGWARNVQPLAPQHVDEVRKIVGNGQTTCCRAQHGREHKQQQLQQRTNLYRPHHLAEVKAF